MCTFFSSSSSFLYRFVFDAFSGVCCQTAWRCEGRGRGSVAGDSVDTNNFLTQRCCNSGRETGSAHLFISTQPTVHDPISASISRLSALCVCLSVCRGCTTDCFGFEVFSPGAGTCCVALCPRQAGNQNTCPAVSQLSCWFAVELHVSSPATKGRQ